MTGNIDESYQVSWMLRDERHTSHYGHTFIFKSLQEQGINKNDVQIRRSLLKHVMID